MSSVTTTMVRIARHPTTRAVARCAVMCAAADRPHPRRDTPGGHNRGCSA
ncbi:hypothetical protein [Rhodococcus opacus]|nr:hypothetical protein [Rhodococcus opacus]